MDPLRVQFRPETEDAKFAALFCANRCTLGRVWPFELAKCRRVKKQTASDMETGLTPQVYINGLVCSDGNTLHFSNDDIVVVVGANNAGKSEFLRNVRDALAEKKSGYVVADVSITKVGSVGDVKNWIASTAYGEQATERTKWFKRPGAQVTEDEIASIWRRDPGRLGSLIDFFCVLLTADKRLSSANPADNISTTKEPLTHPIHYLQADDALEDLISRKFRDAFGLDLIVHRNAGSKVPLHVGLKPLLPAGKDRVSREYIQMLEALPTVHTQGDGVRAFVGMLLHLLTFDFSLLLLDEPEAFLHPPQVRQLAHVIATDIPPERQMFIATHSGEFVRALLESNAGRVRILRLDRDASVNKTSELKNAELKKLWSDPILRYSNILDGLFHKKVIIAESDGDCRFFAAMLGTLPNASFVAHDVLFVHCGGKARVATVTSALFSLAVPLAAVLDVDVLSEEYPLRAIYSSLGGTWDGIEADWKSVKLSVEAKRSELSSSQVKSEVSKILDKVKENNFPGQAAKGIAEVLKRSSPWSIVKSAGISYIPPGEPTQAYQRLRTSLRGVGLFIVEIGELENFDRSVPGHGPKWVNEVLSKNLQDPSFHPARDFVSDLITERPSSARK